MPQYITTTLLSILGALIVAGIVAWIRRPRLAYLVPRLFSKSNISDQGQLAEITVFNRGFSNEEDVVLTLNPKLRYEIVGATSRDNIFSDNKLTIPRIGSNKDITVVLTIEGGAFSQSDIESCLSKSTTGIGVESLAEVPSSGQSKIAGVIAFIFIPLSAFSAFWGFNKAINSEGGAKAAADAASAAADAANAANKAAQSKAGISDEPEGLRGWKVPSYTSKNQLYEDFKRGSLSISIGTSTRTKVRDIVSVPVLVRNLSDNPIKYTVSMTTSASEEDSRTRSFDRMLIDVFIAPNAVSLKDIKVVVPEKIQDPSQRTLWTEVSFNSIDGETLRMTKVSSIDLGP